MKPKRLARKLNRVHQKYLPNITNGKALPPKVYAVLFKGYLLKEEK